MLETQHHGIRFVAQESHLCISENIYYNIYHIRRNIAFIIGRRSLITNTAFEHGVFITEQFKDGHSILINCTIVVLDVKVKLFMIFGSSFIVIERHVVITRYFRTWPSFFVLYKRIKKCLIFVILCWVFLFHLTST